jgi:hypothetical protein
MRHITPMADALDDVLDGTFPASDPPSWTPGLARPAPASAGPFTEAGTPEAEGERLPPP